jgi:hypothetical protein
MAVRRRRLGWIRKLELTQEEQRKLSWDAVEGREYTERLAENALDRRQRAFKDIAPDRLTVRVIAEEEGLSQSAVYERMKKFRIAAFGRDLSDNAIYDRLRNGKRRPGHCEEPGCSQPLPDSAPPNRRYCDTHNTGAARIRRHRRVKHQTARR